MSDNIIVFCRDRNAPSNHTVGKNLTPRSRKGMSPRQDFVYSVSSCLPSTSKAAASDKADLLMGAILRSNKTNDVSSSVLSKCNQRSKPCDKYELIDERTVPSSHVRTTRTESSKCANIKTQIPQCLSNATVGKCCDQVPLKWTCTGDRTKGVQLICDEKVESEVDGRKNLDTPFLNRSVECIKEFLKGDVKLAQENVEVSKCHNFL